MKLFVAGMFPEGPHVPPDMPKHLVPSHWHSGMLEWLVAHGQLPPDAAVSPCYLTDDQNDRASASRSFATTDTVWVASHPNDFWEEVVRGVRQTRVYVFRA